MTALDYAIDLATEYGYPVFPVEVAGGKKRPLTEHGFHDATTCEGTIQAWWKAHPNAIVGVPNDKLLVIDIDPDGIPWLERHALRLGYARSHRTRRGGWHLLYRQPEPPIPRSIGTVAKGVDVCGVGGFTVWWPSAGFPCDGDLLNLVPPPEWLERHLRPAARSGVVSQIGPRNDYIAIAAGATEGERNAKLAKLAGHLLRRDIDARVARSLCYAWSQVNCKPPMDPQEALATIESIAAAELRRRAAMNANGPVETLAALQNSTTEPKYAVDELSKRRKKVGAQNPEGALTLDDFFAYMPAHNYIFVPTRELWPAASVNSRLAPVGVTGGEVSPSSWLDDHRAVEQITWAPGEPELIRHRLIDQGGWIERTGVAAFNQYRAPTPKHGDPMKAGPWRDHVARIYPNEATHIERWMAHRVQRPGEKINHAVVLGAHKGSEQDTILEPVRHAIGPWNFAEVSPTQLLGRFNGFVKSVILRISESRDLGDVDRYAFYEHTKVFIAAPPDVHRCDEKNIREHSVLNVCGVVLTTNHKTDGIFLPADDRRHFVAWSDEAKEKFTATYWKNLYEWYHDGGVTHVAAYLAQLDLRNFDAKAPPPKTAAFYDIVDANRAPEDAELADALDALGEPPAVTIERISDKADTSGNVGFKEWLTDRKNRRKLPHRLESAGYVPVRNGTADDGLWKIGKRRQVVYAKSTMSLRDRLAAAEALCK